MKRLSILAAIAALAVVPGLARAGGHCAPVALAAPVVQVQAVAVPYVQQVVVASPVVQVHAFQVAQIQAVKVQRVRVQKVVQPVRQRVVTRSVIRGH